MKTPDLMRMRRQQLGPGQRGQRGKSSQHDQRGQHEMTQAEAARRAGVSQPYWSLLERGKRPLTDRLARRLVRECGFPPTLLPLPVRLEDAAPAGNDALAEDLAKLDYPAFAYMKGGRRHKRNPALVVLSGLALKGLEPRVYEGLPWLLLRYPDMDAGWMADQARRHDLQNQLGFTATLARRVAEQHTHLHDRAEPMQQLEDALRDGRLAREETFKEKASEGLRRWLRDNRTEDAANWNLLTDWKREHLRYVEVT